MYPAPERPFLSHETTRGGTARRGFASLRRRVGTSSRVYARGLLGYLRLRAEPIVIGGCERSGTTLLLSILSALPSVCAIPLETWALCYGRKAGFGPHRIQKHRLIRGLGECAWSDLLTAERWCEKSPANVFYFREIRQVIGPTRFIQIVRDGRDVVTSVHPDAPERPWVPIDRWKDAVRAGLGLGKRPDVLTIRYRDLVLDTDATIQRLCSFLSEPYGEEARSWQEHATVRASGNLVGEQVGSLHPRSIGKFRRDDCPFPDRVEALMADREAVALLDEYGFRKAVSA